MIRVGGDVNDICASNDPPHFGFVYGGSQGANRRRILQSREIGHRRSGQRNAPHFDDLAYANFGTSDERTAVVSLYAVSKILFLIDVI